ncbi:MAG: hypothetical protein GX344_05840 [Intrasporangiaceae bacterium]|nr:hypothetical protein [Intrasporangiaceae bacterium]
MGIVEVLQISTLQPEHLANPKGAPRGEGDGDPQMIGHRVGKRLDLFWEGDIPVFVLGAHPAMFRRLGEVEGLQGAGPSLHGSIEHRAEHDRDVRCNAIDAGVGVARRSKPPERPEMVGHALGRQVGQSDVPEVLENVPIQDGTVRHDGRRRTIRVGLQGGQPRL